MTGGIARFARKKTHSPKKKNASETSTNNGLEKEVKNSADSSVNLSGFDSGNDFGQGQEAFGGWGELGLSIDNHDDFPSFMDGNDNSISGVGEFNFGDDDVGYVDFGGYETHGSSESSSLANDTTKEESSSGIAFVKSRTSGIQKSSSSPAAGFQERNDGTSLSKSSMALLPMAARSVKNAPMQLAQDRIAKGSDDSGRSEAPLSGHDNGRVPREIASPLGFNHGFPVPRTPSNGQEVNLKNSGRVNSFIGAQKYSDPSSELRSSNSVQVTPPSITMTSTDGTTDRHLPGIMAKVTRSPLAGGPVLPGRCTSGPKCDQFNGPSHLKTPGSPGSGTSSLGTTQQFKTPGIIQVTRDMDMPPPPSAVTPNTNTKAPSVPDSFEKYPHSDPMTLNGFSENVSKSSLSDEHEQFTGADVISSHSSNSFQDAYQDFSRSLRDFQDKEKLYSSTVLDLTAQLSISHAAMLQTQGEMLDLTKDLESMLDSVNMSIESIYDK